MRCGNGERLRRRRGMKKRKKCGRIRKKKAQRRKKKQRRGRRKNIQKREEDQEKEEEDQEEEDEDVEKKEKEANKEGGQASVPVRALPRLPWSHRQEDKQGPASTTTLEQLFTSLAHGNRTSIYFNVRNAFSSKISVGHVCKHLWFLSCSRMYPDVFILACYFSYVRFQPVWFVVLASADVNIPSLPHLACPCVQRNITPTTGRNWPLPPQLLYCI